MTERTTTNRGDLERLYATSRSTIAFVWTHLISIIAISLGWFLAALPLVTIGPATVGAYAAVHSLREGDDGVDYARVRSIVRTQFVHATLLGVLPLLIGAIGMIYLRSYLLSGSPIGGAFAILALNAAVYAWIVSIPTFVALARGTSVVRAVTTGVEWSARHGVSAIALAIITVVLFTVTSVLTVAVALVFAGVAFAFHVEFIATTTRAETITTTTPDP